MNFDSVLEATGGFGTYQVVSLIWYQSVLWLIVLNVSFMVFGGIPQKYHCEWLHESVPQTREVYSPEDLFSGTGFNQTTLAEVKMDYNCTVVQGGFHSVLMDWSLTGSFGLKLAAWMASGQMLGTFFGPPICGQLSDQFGRRRIFLVSFISLLVFCAGSAFLTSWPLFLVARFLIGLSIGATQSVHFVIIQELLLPKYRLLIYAGGWPLGFIYAGLLAYFTNHWRWFTIASALTGLPGLLLSLFWIEESPKWLLEKNRPEEALQILQKIASRNGVRTFTGSGSGSGSGSVSEPALVKLLRTVSVDRSHQEPSSKSPEIDGGEINNQSISINNVATTAVFNKNKPAPKTNKVYTYVHLFRNRAETIRTLTMGYSWFTMALLYYALLFSVGSLAGNPAINVAALGAIRLAVAGLLILLDRNVAWIGRRMFHQTGLLLVAVATLKMALVTVIYGENDQSGVSKVLLLVAAIVGTTACSPLWTACECFTAEVFPTALRTMGYAFCSSAARIGGAISPQLLLLALVWPPLGYLVLASLALANWFVSYFLLPETKGKPLPDLADEETLKGKQVSADKTKTDDSCYCSSNKAEDEEKCTSLSA